MGGDLVSLVISRHTPDGLYLEVSSSDSNLELASPITSAIVLNGKTQAQIAIECDVPLKL